MLRDPEEITSHWEARYPCKIHITVFVSHTKLYLGLGGQELKMHCIKQHIIGCFPIMDPSTGGRVTDNIERLVFMVLYSLPFWKQLSGIL